MKKNENSKNLTISKMYKTIKVKDMQYEERINILKAKVLSNFENLNKTFLLNRQTTQQTSHGKATNANIDDETQKMWKLILPFFRSVNERELLGNTLVPRAYRLPNDKKSINYPTKKFTKTSIPYVKSIRPNFISILNSCYVPIDSAIDKPFSMCTEIENDKNDEDWSVLDTDSRIKYELMSLGLGQESPETMSESLMDEIIDVKSKEFIAVAEANVVREYLVSRMQNKKDQIEHYNFLCKCTNSE